MNYRKHFASVAATILLTLAFAMAQSHIAVADNPDSAYIKHEMDMEFDFNSFWDVGFPPQGSYFWNATAIRFDFFATAPDCDIDLFMLLERNKKGSVGNYTNSEKAFYKEQGVTNVAQGFEFWAGDNGDRVVGYVRAAGPGGQIGIMSYRQADASTPYMNKTYSIVNRGNLLTILISAPQSSWEDSECSSEVADLMSTFRVHGEPDFREQGIAEYYRRETGQLPPSNTDAASSGSSGKSSSNSNSVSLKEIENVCDAFWDDESVDPDGDLFDELNDLCGMLD